MNVSNDTELNLFSHHFSESGTGLLETHAQYSAQARQATQLVVIDSGVEGYDQLIQQISDNTAVLILDEEVDGILQIDRAFDQLQNLLSVHIVAHGSAGQIQLGATDLNSETLAFYEDTLESWSDVLSDTADILLYGCNVGASSEGQTLLAQLSHYTGADIAASVDLTGNAALGGNWDLEAHVGDIEAELPVPAEALQSFLGLLDATTPIVQNDPNFQNELVVSGLSAPTSLSFLPDGRALILEKNGQILITDPNATVPTLETYLVLPDILTNGEKGLIDIALHPDFEQNNLFYLYYTLGSDKKFQISQFTHQGNTADLSSEVVIWKDPNPASSPDHFGGGLFTVREGGQDYIFLTTGDKGLNTPQLAQDLTRIEGAILRLNIDGTIPDDNPFVDGPGGNADEIWAYGLRNPFRASYDEATGDIYIGDVGFDTIEEVNRININNGSGVNFGWPLYEGTSNGTPGFVDAIYEYEHTDAALGGSGAVIGGFVYRGTLFPEAFQGAYFFGDYTQDNIQYLQFDTNGDVIDADPSTAALDAFLFEERTRNLNPEVKSPSFFGEGPDGALYFINFQDSSLRRITYFDPSGGNQSPEIDETATAATLVNGFTYDFVGVANDPDGDSITYTWDFGDGSSQVVFQDETPNNPSDNVITHTYASNGEYQATLVVSDGQPATPDDSYKLPLIQIGDPPSADIVLRAADGTPLNIITEPDPLTGEARKVIKDAFRAGDTILFDGIGTDSDGVLTESSYDWKIEFLHDDHTHPELNVLDTSSGSFTTTTTEHGFVGDIQTGYTFELTVTDADGLVSTEKVAILPETVNLTFNDNLPGDFDDFLVDGIERNSTDSEPFSLETAVNFQHTVTAPETREVNGFTYVFESWSTGETSRTITFAAPDEAQSYIANYVDPNPAEEPPVAQNDGPITVVAGTIDNVLDVLLNDSDPDPGDTLTISGLSLTDALSSDTTLTTVNGSSVSVNESGDRILYTPGDGFAGEDIFYYTLEDSTGRTATASVTVGIDDGQLPITDGLVLHLDADQNVVTDGSDLVTEWLDQSTASNDLTGGGDPRLVSGAVNGHNAIHFDGDGDKLERTLDVNLPDGNSERTVFFVAKYNSVGNGGFSYGQARRAKAFGLVVDETGKLGLQAWGNANDQITAEAGTGQGWLIQSAKLEAGMLTQYKDGVEIGTDTVDYNTSLTKLLIGSEIDGNPFVDLEVASVITYDRALGESERQQIENFLQQRYLASQNPVNNSPEAMDDSYSIDANSLDNVLSVLGNDTDPDGDPLLISAAQTSEGGTVEITPDGLIYSPESMFTGTETITYTLSDGRGGTDTAQVVINVVENNNLAPDANDDSFTVTEDSLDNVFSVLENDTDPDTSSGLIDFSDHTIELAPTYNRPLKVIDEVTGGTLDGVNFVFDASDVGEQAHFHQPLAPDFLTQHNVAGNGAQVNFTFARQDGQGFAFESFDYTTALHFNQDAAANAGLTVFGTLASGGTISQSFDAADMFDTFQTANLTGFGWNNVTSVRFVGDRIETGGPTADITQELNIDNIVVSAALSITAVSPADNGGSVSVNGETLIYTPAANFSGEETFTYTVEDTFGASDTATVTVTVESVNDVPVAVGDTYSVDQDSVENVLNILANDSDADGDALTIVDLTQPDNGGSVSISAEGTQLIYTPASGFSGTETFTYNLQDPSGASNPFSPAAVSITVNEPSNLPNISGLVLHLDADNGVSADGAQVTEWADQSGSGNDLSATGDPNLVIGALNGHNVIDLDGEGDALQRLSDISGLPTGNSDRTIFLVANYNGVGNGGFTYGRDRRGKTFGLVVDENGKLGVQGWGSANDQITNEAGTNQGWLVQSVKLDAGILTQYKNGALIDTDTVDYNTVLTKILLGAELDGSPFVDMSVASVMVFDRALSTTEQQSVEDYLQSKYFGETTGGGPSNSSPTAVDDTASTLAEVPVSIDVLSNDSDSDGDALTLSVVTAPTNGTAIINDQGTTDLSDDEIIYTPTAGSIGSDTFVYQVDDGNGGVAQATVNITVNAPGGGSSNLPISGGLVLHLDAEQSVTTDGSGGVTDWQDQSSAGNSVSASGDPTLVANAINGRSAIRLDGAGDQLSRTIDGSSQLPTGNGDRTVFFVANYRSNGNGGLSYGKSRRAKAFGLVVDENGKLGVQGWGSANDKITDEVGTGQGWGIQAVTLEAGLLNQYKNGVLIGSDSVSFNTVLSQLVIGAEIDGSPFVDMDVAEILIFDRALSESERQQIDAYLLTKYFGV